MKINNNNDNNIVVIIIIIILILTIISLMNYIYNLKNHIIIMFI